MVEATTMFIIGLGIWGLGILLLIFEMFFGLENIGQLFATPSEETVPKFETDPARSIYHKLPDGTLARVTSEMFKRKMKSPKTGEMVVWNQYGYDNHEPEIFPADAFVDENVEARLGLDGGIKRVVLDPDQEKKDLRKTAMQLTNELSVKNADIARLHTSHENYMNRFGETADKLGKAVGKVNVSNKPVKRKEGTAAGAAEEYIPEEGE